MSQLYDAKRYAQYLEIDIARKLKYSEYSYKDGNSRKRFITAPSLEKIWRAVSIPKLFIYAKWDSVEHEKVQSNFARIVSILIEIQWPRLITDFESLFFNVPERTDANLPFSMNDLVFLDQSSREAFFAAQYAYVPFVIEEEDAEKELPDQIVLPFEADPKPIGQGQGVFGDVYKVTIPSGCLRWRASSNRRNVNNESWDLAFKQLSRKDDHKRELYSLNVILQSLKSHENITRYTQAVSQGDWLRIFFPYADYGSLQDLFERPSEFKLSFTKENLVSALQHMVDGVAHLHADVFVQGDRKGSYKYGAHLDLKPGNVLVFPNTQGEQGVGVWKITDFGISSFKDVKDRIPLQGPEGSGTTGALGTSTVCITGMTGPKSLLGGYCAPELHPSMKVLFSGYPVDMWSIGCMLSDVVCFALDRGESWGGIARFRYNRMGETLDDYYFEVSDEDQTCLFRLKNAVPVFLGRLLTDYPKERRWVKDCLVIISELLRIEPSERPGADSVSKRLAHITFDQDELDPLGSWNDKVQWDTSTSGHPNTRPIAQLSKLKSQESIGNDSRVSTSLSKSHAELSLQMPHMTLKESRDERQAFSGNELSQCSSDLAAETDGINSALLKHEPMQTLHTPSTHLSAASDSAGQEPEAGHMHGSDLHSFDHMFPFINIHDPQVYVPYEVKENIYWWLESNESRSLWVCAPPLTPGWETNYGQVWANALQLMVSESGFPLLCYSVEDMGSAISEPVLEMTLTLNSQMVRYEVGRCAAQNTYEAHNLEDSLINLRRHLTHLSSALRAPTFCIIYGLEKLSGESRQGLQSFFRVLLDECAVCRLKTLLTTNGNSEVLEKLKSIRRTSPSHIHDDWALSNLVMPSY